MDFKGTRENIMGLLLSCGLQEVNSSKALVPQNFPAGIVSLSERFGHTQLMTGYANQMHKFDIHIVVEQSQLADEELIELIEKIDNTLQETLYTEIDKTVFYDSMLSAKEIKVAKFEVTL
jgi:hypothetical protein